MRRNQKALGLALVAVFAISAIASSAASATEARFTSPINWTILDTATVGSHAFKVEGEAEEMSCSSVGIDMTSMIDTYHTQLTGTPTYGTTLANKVTEAVATTSGCTVLASGSVTPATVHTENCHYTFTAEPTPVTSEGELYVTGTNEPSTCEIKITVYFLGEFRPCFEFHDQTATYPTVDYTNETYTAGGVNKWDIKVKSTVKGLTFRRKGSCVGSKPEEANNLEYVDEITIKGTDTAGVPADVTWDPRT